MAKAKSNWMQKVTPTLKKGALRATAKHHGALKNGISSSWLNKAAKGNGVSELTKKRAVLAKTFKKARANKAKKK